MPIYEYECAKCGTTIEVIQKFSDQPLKKHKGCGGALTKLISAAGFQFKGSGWYVTDYARKSQKDGSESQKETSKDSKETSSDGNKGASVGEPAGSKEPKAHHSDPARSVSPEGRNIKDGGSDAKKREKH